MERKEKDALWDRYCTVAPARQRRCVERYKIVKKALSERLGLNYKTVSKWRHRDFVYDIPMRPKTLILQCLRARRCIGFFNATGSANCLKMRRKSRKRSSKKYPIGYFHIDITEACTETGKLYLFVAIDRTSKFAYVELLEKQGKIQATEFLKNLIEKVPYKIHTILTDNGVQFTNQTRNHRALPYIFDRVCEKNGIEYKLTLPAHPWTNGQVERMNKTIKEATVHRYYYESQTQLQEHLQAFIDAYNFAKRLKSLNGLTPWEFIVKEWKSNPKSSRTKFDLYKLGLNNIPIPS